MDWPTLFLAASFEAAVIIGFWGGTAIERIMLHLAARKVSPLGDPCDKLSDEQPHGDIPHLPRGIVGERVSHSTETTR